MTRLKEFVVPLPPLPEQRRIVAKVDELMKRCDELEARQKERNKRRTILTASCLHALSSPTDHRSHASITDHRSPNTDKRALQRVLDNFPVLLDTPESVAELRKTILQLAVQGRLVPQDQKDEPAVALKQQSTRADQRMSTASEEKPYSLPKGWMWTMLGDYLVSLQTGPFGSSLHKSDYIRGGVPIVNPMHITDNGIVPSEHMTVSQSTFDRLSVFKINVGDIVMARRGEVGRCAVATEQEAGWLCGTGSLLLKLPRSAYAPFFAMVIRSPLVRDYLGAASVGATMVNLNQRILLNMVIGVPPLAEQKRIVAKVNQLMALCDAIETKLCKSRNDADTIAAAASHHFCNSTTGQLKQVEA